MSNANHDNQHEEDMRRVFLAARRLIYRSSGIVPRLPTRRAEMPRPESIPTNLDGVFDDESAVVSRKALEELRVAVEKITEEAERES